MTRRTLLTCSVLVILAVTPVPSAAAKAARQHISFRPPIDFATGADPSSAEFNEASGDQMGSNPTRFPFSDSVAIGDFDHDGKTDVAQTNVIAGSVSVFLGDGDAGFAPPVLHPVGEHPNFVVARDLDRDGHLDLAVADTGSNDVAILRGTGVGTFHDATYIPVPAPRAIAIGQFNEDGHADLAVSSSGPTTGPSATVGGVSILTGRGDATFSLSQFVVPTFGGRPTSANVVAAGDFDGSGFDDLAVGVGASQSAGDRAEGNPPVTGDDALIFLNRDGAPFEATEDQRIRVGAFPSSIVVADVNGDANPDLAVADSFSGDITTLLGDSSGTFVVASTNVTVGGNPRAVAVGDFDDDGRPDLVTANFWTSTVSVLRGNGNGTFEPAVDFWSGDATSGVAVGHFDDDDRLDLAVGRLRNDQLALLLNDSSSKGDGVTITRDVSYGGDTDPDPFAAHHVLDVYEPPRGTTSFAGRGRPYPVVLLAHGGVGLTGDKSEHSYLMRSLAEEGIIAISTDYRLTGAAQLQAQTDDVARAFRWTHANAARFGGDPEGIVVAGHSNGGLLTGRLALDASYAADQVHIRGVVTIGVVPGAAPAPSHRPSLVLTGTEGLETALNVAGAAYARGATMVGASSTHETVAGRDHFTLVSNLARNEDAGRAHLLNFLRNS